MISVVGPFVDRRRMLEVALTVLVAITLLAAAEGRYPYGFYMALRTAATVGGAFWAVRVYHAGPRGWMWAFLAAALLLNPILPVRMQRSQWQPIDLCLGLLLLAWSGYWAFRKPSGR
jgi:putative copper export protein